MNLKLELDWPAARAGVAVVSPSGEQRASRGGVGGGHGGDGD